MAKEKKSESRRQEKKPAEGAGHASPKESRTITETVDTVTVGRSGNETFVSEEIVTTETTMTVAEAADMSLFPRLLDKLNSEPMDEEKMRSFEERVARIKEKLRKSKK